MVILEVHTAVTPLNVFMTLHLEHGQLYLFTLNGPSVAPTLQVHMVTMLAC